MNVDHPLSSTELTFPSMNTETFLHQHKQKFDKVVLNLDNYNNGTHWVGIKKIKPKTDKNVEIWKYKDSFGVEPPPLFPTKSEKLILYNPYQYQKKDEINCGAYANNFLL